LLTVSSSSLFLSLSISEFPWLQKRVWIWRALVWMVGWRYGGIVNFAAPELSAQTLEAAPEEQKAASVDASTLLPNHDPPWSTRNNNGDTPFLLAIHNKREKLAAKNGCDGLAKKITEEVDKNGLNSLLTFSDGSNILHLEQRTSIVLELYIGTSFELVMYSKFNV